MPVPLPSSFVVKNGSNTFARVSASIPVPESVTSDSQVVARHDVKRALVTVLFIQRDGLGREHKLTTIGHGIAGIKAKIQQYVLKLAPS